MITRFAPSPTGSLHLGHAFSAITAHDAARAAGGTFLLRIEDLDQTRCRPEYEQGIYEDLDWLGLSWDGDVWQQSKRAGHYQAALAVLETCDLLFPCSCSRSQIRAAAQARGQMTFGPDGLVYPGTCQDRPMADRRPGDTLRLNMGRALTTIGQDLHFPEMGPAQTGHVTVAPTALLKEVGDVVLVRRETGAAAYHLACICDDAAQGITHVIRGQDLFKATQIHVVLQRLLGLPTPFYHHHRLITDTAGKRLAKRDDSKAIAKYRSEGISPDEIRRMIGL
ncbi:tRNA glutamyl-Q(34) synthetase GluQRS [Actibacterium sp. 188UL27-1]|uniref:tRNA glutamyl-Q(34) synthetase GluQRS n=1 Tax=Actibacterium sp. 188UL27-1 TaxID=2786961 RepID=UPI00195AF300|nr:tRNA glutamyl-Q(34) synthetase GluQRS [Actibacterium sp. 188UL27-1]MBM7067696.1 tRNA glutamyl-Q(34) synthetase GluQRS [Actibacterium sp. 188UL27-1]